MRLQQLCAEDSVVLAVPVKKNQRVAVPADVIAERDAVDR
jgi:hypothetical protein